MKPAKRILSFALALLLCAELLPAQAYLRREGETKPAEIALGDGKTVEVEESWEELYPYGAFLFSDSEAYAEEGGGSETIKLYRLGGTAGRATAYVAYVPVVYSPDGENPAYASAAGAGDVVIEVEDPLPIAQYQAVGRDPDPEPSAAGISEAAWTDEKALEGDRVLTLDTEAEAYRWYVFSEGRWEAVEDATEAEFVVQRELLAEMDVRCEFTRGGVRYCSVSLRGEAYVKPEALILPEQPAARR